jgi:glycosyltransferase involved in cell wall biosynthesis
MSRIVFSANTSWYLHNFRKNTISRVLQLGHEVYCLAPKDNYSIKLQELGATYVDISLDKGGRNPFHDLRTIISIFFKIRNISPDLIFTFTPKINIYAALASTIFRSARVIQNISGLGVIYNEDGAFYKKIVGWLYMLSFHVSEKIYFQNIEDYERMRRLTNVNPAKLSVIPGSGVDLKRFKYVPQVKSEYTRFLFVGRLIKEKGINFYFEAANIIAHKNSQVRFGVLGIHDPGKPGSITEEEIDAVRAKAHIDILETSDNVEEIIVNYDCVVLPTFYGEGLPKSLLEAGAIGRPIITTNIAGCSDLVVNGFNGFLVEPKSTKSLCEAIQSFIDMQEEDRLRMGRNARKYVEQRYNEEIVIREYVQNIRFDNRSF